MSPKILVTGRGGRSGSWQIRGVQLGAAIGGEVQALAEYSDCLSAHVIVVVKRTAEPLMRHVARSGKPWVWDVVDAWPQQIGSAWPRSTAVHWLRSEIERLQPTAMVFTTESMRNDSGFVGPSLVLPHHAWPKYRPNLVRQRVAVVGYEGGEHYLGRWKNRIEAACERRGWRFSINEDMQQADIGIAVRDGGGYPAAEWKSNCKLANLQAMGLPAVISPERGYREFGNGSECVVSNENELAHAFDVLADCDVRAAISALQQESAPRLERVASEYREWLCALASF